MLKIDLIKEVSVCEMRAQELLRIIGYNPPFSAFKLK